MAKVGGVSSVPDSDAENSIELQDLAQFAVTEHNASQNSELKYVRLVSAKQQVVSGVMYYLTIEAESPLDGSKQLYEAKVWVKKWENFKKLEAFTAVQ